MRMKLPPVRLSPNADDRKDFVSPTDLLAALSVFDANSVKIIVFIDACYSGNFIAPLSILQTGRPCGVTLITSTDSTHQYTIVQYGLDPTAGPATRAAIRQIGVLRTAICGRVLTTTFTPSGCHLLEIVVNLAATLNLA